MSMLERMRPAGLRVGVLAALLGEQAGPLGLRISLFFGAIFLAYGIIVPYFPLWLHARGLSPVEIATITAAPLFVRVFFTPCMGLLADLIGNYRRIIIALAWSAVALAIIVANVSGFGPILVVGVAMLLCTGTMLPLIETVAVGAVRSSGLDYGRMRLWGSVTFIVANFTGGLLLEALGGGFGIWLIASGTLMTLAAAHLLPRPQPGAAKVQGAKTHWRLSLPVRMLGSRQFLLFLVAMGCTHGAHATFYTFGALYWQSQGLSAAWVGTLWAIGVTAEVALFAFSGPAVRSISPVKLILAGAAVSVFRWTVMALEPPLVVLVPLQVLHAFTYGAAHLGAILFISRAVPHKGMGSAQSYYAVMAGGLVLGLVGLASGPLYASFGGRVFFLAAAVAALGCAAAILLLRQWHGGLLWPEPEGLPEEGQAPGDAAASPTGPAAAG